MPPDTEITRLADGVMDAERAAGQGSPMDGYEALLAGLRRAELARQTAEEWAPELARCWQLALEAFCRRHGIDARLPQVPLAPHPTGKR